MFIKVAHITLGMSMGGIETLIVNMAKSIDRGKFTITVGCLDTGGDLLKQIHQLGWDSFIMGRKPGHDWRLIIRLVRLFSRHGFHVIHTHNQAAHFYAGLAARIVGVPCLVTTEHSRHYINEKLRRRLEKKALSLITDRWVSVNHELARLSIDRDALPSRKIRVILNGIDIERFSKPDDITTRREIFSRRENLGFSSDDKIVIMVARFHPIKNHAMLLKAVAAVADYFHGCLHILLAGDGELRTQLKELTHQLGLSNLVHFLGVRNDVEQLLWLSDVLVLCSISEGLPVTVLEAWAARTPVLITRSANQSGIVEDGKNGWLVGNTVGDLAKGLIDSLTCHNLNRIMMANAFNDVAQRFSLQSMARNYEGLYREVLGERGMVFR